MPDYTQKNFVRTIGHFWYNNLEMINLVELFFLALLGSIIALIGGVVFLYSQKLSKALEYHSIPFAAGVLITVSLLGLLPEAIEIAGEGVLVVVLVSFFTSYFFEHIFFEIHHHKEVDHHHKHNFTSSVPLIIVGDTIHNFIDGIAIGASYLVSPGLGLITAFSSFLHEIPHEIADFGILLRAGWKKKDILIINVISASTTIVGAFAILLFSENSNLLGGLLGVSAGIFLYLGSVDFLPHSSEKFSDRPKSVIPLAMGILIMVTTLLLFQH